MKNKPKEAINFESKALFRDELLKQIDQMYHFAFSLTHNQVDAEDLVQEALLKALKNYKQFSKGTNIKAWLFTIIRNSYINWYRKQQRGPTEVDFNEVAPLVPATEDFTIHHELGVESLKKIDQLEDNLEDKVKNALNDLPEQFKQIFLLAVIENLSYKEIAEILDIPVGTVMSRLFRARKQMYLKLKNYADELGILTPKAQKKENTKEA